MFVLAWWIIYLVLEVVTGVECVLKSQFKPEGQTTSFLLRWNPLCKSIKLCYIISCWYNLSSHSTNPPRLRTWNTMSWKYRRRVQICLISDVCLSWRFVLAHTSDFIPWKKRNKTAWIVWVTFHIVESKCGRRSMACDTVHWVSVISVIIHMEIWRSQELWGGCE